MKHIQKRFMAYQPSPSLKLNDYVTRTIPKYMYETARKEYPPFKEWHDVQSFPMQQQQDLWLFREWLNTNIFMFVADKIERAKKEKRTAVSFGQYTREIPRDFDIGDYYFYSFGSSKVTSDIDVTIEGPAASFLIACIEDAWLEITGEPSRVWDVEYYGDFLMFETPEKSFLNSRRFEPFAARIMPYVGVSILRNGVSLNDPEIDTFVEKHPILNTAGWKEKATTLFQSVKSLSYDAMREKYYMALQRAESARDAKQNSETNRHIETFLALADANMYRSENYILPSTVIHVVRDIQAKSPAPESKQCELFSVKLASCALGRFTYLCSALEQLGYRLRFRDQPAKIAKYQERMDNALDKAGQEGGRQRKPRTLFRRTRYARGSSRMRPTRARRRRRSTRSRFAKRRA